jgi:hypothetical protein
MNHKVVERIGDPRQWSLVPSCIILTEVVRRLSSDGITPVNKLKFKLNKANVSDKFPTRLGLSP